MTLHGHMAKLVTKLGLAPDHPALVQPFLGFASGSGGLQTCLLAHPCHMGVDSEDRKSYLIQLLSRLPSMEPGVSGTQTDSYQVEGLERRVIQGWDE